MLLRFPNLEHRAGIRTEKAKSGTFFVQTGLASTGGTCYIGHNSSPVRGMTFGCCRPMCRTSQCFAIGLISERLLPNIVKTIPKLKLIFSGRKTDRHVEIGLSESVVNCAVRHCGAGAARRVFQCGWKPPNSFTRARSGVLLSGCGETVTKQSVSWAEKGVVLRRTKRPKGSLWFEWFQPQS